MATLSDTVDALERSHFVFKHNLMTLEYELPPVLEIQGWLAEEGMITGVKTITDAACLLSKPYHPVRDYLNSLTWDGLPRLSTWLTDYMQAPPGTGGEHMLLSMVARVMRPGCKVDTVTVLHGASPARKDALNLIGGEWFGGDPPARDDFRMSQYMRGKWLIDIDERKPSFISSQVEGYVPAWGREQVREPRQCVFASTHDIKSTNRHWIHVDTGYIDLKGLSAARDQLFAEAFVGGWR